MRIANLLSAGHAEGFAPSAVVVGDDVTVEPVMMQLPALPPTAAELLACRCRRRRSSDPSGRRRL
jgi:hypothetical protein